MRALWIVCCLCLLSQLSQAQSYHKGVRISGDVLAAGLPVAALVTTLVEKDYQGTKQLVFSGVSAAAVTYLLKATVKKERPDGSNFHSFPSAHSAAAFAGATFLQRRYGWKFGVPAYVLSTYVAWSRVYAKKHDVWDVTAGAAISAAASLIFTRPFAKKHHLVLSPVMIDDKAGLYASFTF